MLEDLNGVVYTVFATEGFLYVGGQFLPFAVKLLVETGTAVLEFIGFCTLVLISCCRTHRYCIVLDCLQ